MDLVTIDHLLTTTRTVRKRLNLTRPVESDIIQRGRIGTGGGIHVNRSTHGSRNTSYV